MKKLYSIVLMATALLIGTNAWANSVWDALSTAQGSNKISVTINGTTKYAPNLQTAVNAVEPNQAATIMLLDDQELTATVLIPNYLDEDTVSTKNPSGVQPIRERELQDITLNLNGFNITEKSGSNIGLIQLVKGRLHITGEGELKQTHAGGSDNINKSVIFVSGAPYASKKTEWSTLIIDENVFLNATGKANEGDVTTGKGSKNYGITVDILLKKTGKNSIGYVTAASVSSTSYVDANVDDNGKYFSDTNIKCWAKSDWNKAKTQWKTKKAGCAYGVKVIVKGKVYGNMRAINFAGNINAMPECDENWTTKGRRYSKPANEGRYYDNFYPYVKIESTATLWCLNDGLTDGNGAIYAGGYGVWDVSGNIHGQTGILVKSGDVKLIDAIVKSDSQNSANSGEYHGEVSGTGVFIASDQSYAGGVAVEITGDTKVTGGGSAAIVDAYATNSTETQVSNLSITGGTIEPGAQGGITLTTGTAAATQATGGNIQGDIKIGDTETTVSAIVPTTGYHTTTIKDENGKDVIVITPGNAPTGYATIQAALEADKKSVKLTGASDEINTDIVLDELEINETTNQVLRIKKSLTVGRVVLGDKAQVIVEPGATFIVTGAQGIVAPVAENIVLQNEGALVAADRKFATFLFNPAVTSNRHPNATVEMTTYSFGNNASDYQWERFGIPTWNALKSITTSSAVRSRFTVFDGTAWQELGYLNPNGGETAVNKANFNKPFATYNLLAYRASDAAAPTYQFAGELVGNIDASLDVTTYWTPFTNSYSANLSLPALFAAVKAGTIIDEYVYVAQPQGLGTYYWKAWDAETDGFSAQKLAPMQAFMLKKVYGSTQTESVAMNYNTMVYTPATTPSLAPRRQNSSDYTARMCVVVSNVNGVCDELQLRETATLTKEAEKYMNSDVNIYATTEDKATILAVENLENTYVGFSTVKGGNFAISFANVMGTEYTLIDHETGARVAMVEGNVYEFTADANSVNDYRFEIVATAKVPTAIENTEAVKSVKGIYTITGQYVGEMNVWNTLPAGVYVVNGEKRVK